MWASDRLKDNDEIVLASLVENSMALEYASDRLRDNEEIVLAAVKKNGRALYFASDRLRDTEEIVLVAVNPDGLALEHASDRLRSDIDFCIQCTKISPICMNFVLGKAAELFSRYQWSIEEVEAFWQGVKQQQLAQQQKMKPC